MMVEVDPPDMAVLGGASYRDEPIKFYRLSKKQQE